MQRCGWVSQDPLYIEYHDTNGVWRKKRVASCLK
ncbi:3-methyl-adenine DNA glycosylase I [Klebsiella pneumoniae]|uniref:3-methyl-adenine DNA glycosylase I n=1 Tax=Klebsiella pneumoniae TaxID=573 RepID=A0A2X3D7P3_KLEPN|nr:3-methyl-adenine DNA glycosylase I [Klebsiella pneumoniae]